MNEREIRAFYNEDTITVYQAYNDSIALSAVKNQTFISPPFKKDRMTWIKPSFLWMMYRSGWGTKENQNNILAIQIKREGFEWALEHSCISHFDAKVYPSHDDWKRLMQTSPVRIQWDPEKDFFFNPLPHKSIQIGLSGVAVEKYISEWIVQIENITPLCKTIFHHLTEKRIETAKNLLPVENLYSLNDVLKLKVNSNS